MLIGQNTNEKCISISVSKHCVHVHISAVNVYSSHKSHQDGSAMAVWVLRRSHHLIRSVLLLAAINSVNICIFLHSIKW